MQWRPRAKLGAKLKSFFVIPPRAPSILAIKQNPTKFIIQFLNSLKNDLDLKEKRMHSSVTGESSFSWYDKKEETSNLALVALFNQRNLYRCQRKIAQVEPLVCKLTQTTLHKRKSLISNLGAIINFLFMDYHSAAWEFRLLIYGFELRKIYMFMTISHHSVTTCSSCRKLLGTYFSVLRAMWE